MIITLLWMKFKLLFCVSHNNYYGYQNKVWGSGMAHWWERLPSTLVQRVNPLRQRSDNNKIASIIPTHYLYRLEQRAANPTLRWLHCSAKQKVSFVSRSTKDLQRRRLGKLSFFCICYFSKTKSKPTKKNTGQCLLTKTKPTCKNWDKSGKKKKKPA